MAADMATDPTAELNDVLAQYDLGELVRFERDRRGTVNVSYYVETRQGTQRHEYFLRAYKRGIKRDEILFEHSLIDHIVARGACPVARLHRARNGATFYQRTASGAQNQRKIPKSASTPSSTSCMGRTATHGWGRSAHTSS